MKSLPVEVADEEVEEMFDAADLNKDGSIGMAEFSLMVRRRTNNMRYL